MKENDLQPVTDPDFELLAVNRAEGFRAGVQFFCLPPLELGEYTGFTQPIQPRPIRELTIELEINRRHGDEDRAAQRIASSRAAAFILAHSTLTPPPAEATVLKAENR